jgi:MFS family permease
MDSSGNETDNPRIYYIQIIYNAALIPVFWFILRETRGDVILKKRAQKLRKSTGREIYAESELDKPSVVQLLKVSFMRPTKMLVSEPVVIFFTLWISFAWGILFLFFSSVVQTFGDSYGFGIFQTGLVQLAITVGAVIGTLINPLQDWMYLRTAGKNDERPGKPIPEARLYTSIPGSLLFTAGLFIYGWTCRPSIHWIVPAIGVAIVGVGIYSIYMGVVNYLTDAYEKYAASALSAASLGRNSFGAFLPLASGQLFSTLGFGWAGSLLGFVGLALSVVPVVLLFKGREIRARSPFMLDSTFDSDEGEGRKNSYSTKGQGRTAGGPSGGENEV